MRRTLHALMAAAMLAACTNGSRGNTGYPALIAFDPSVWVAPADDGGTEELAVRAARLRARAIGLQTAVP